MFREKCQFCAAFDPRKCCWTSTISSLVMSRHCSRHRHQRGCSEDLARSRSLALWIPFRRSRRQCGSKRQPIQAYGFSVSVDFGLFQLAESSDSQTCAETTVVLVVLVCFMDLAGFSSTQRQALALGLSRLRAKWAGATELASTARLVECEGTATMPHFVYQFETPAACSIAGDEQQCDDKEAVAVDEETISRGGDLASVWSAFRHRVPSSIMLDAFPASDALSSLCAFITSCEETWPGAAELQKTAIGL